MWSGMPIVIQNNKSTALQKYQGMLSFYMWLGIYYYIYLMQSIIVVTIIIVIIIIAVVIITIIIIIIVIIVILFYFESEITFTIM